MLEARHIMFGIAVYVEAMAIIAAAWWGQHYEIESVYPARLGYLTVSIRVSPRHWLQVGPILVCRSAHIRPKPGRIGPGDDYGD